MNLKAKRENVSKVLGRVESALKVCCPDSTSSDSHFVL